jgi:hypothetical protein
MDQEEMHTSVKESDRRKEDGSRRKLAERNDLKGRRRRKKRILLLGSKLRGRAMLEQ